MIPKDQMVNLYYWVMWSDYLVCWWHVVVSCFWPVITSSTALKSRQVDLQQVDYQES